MNLISRESFTPANTFSNRVKNFFSSNKNSFLTFKNKNSYKFDSEINIHKIDIDSRTTRQNKFTMLSSDIDSLKSKVDVVYCIYSNNYNVLNKVFMFESYNKLIQLLNDGYLVRYKFNQFDNSYDEEKKKLFKIAIITKN